MLLQKGRDISLTDVDISSSTGGSTSNGGININIRNGDSADGADVGSENIKLDDVTLTYTGTTPSTGLSISAGLEVPVADNSALSGVVLKDVVVTGYAIDLALGGQVASDIAFTGVQLNGVGTGLRISDVESSTTYNLGNTTFAGTLTKYIDNADSQSTVNATGATFGGQLAGSGLTPAQAFPITAKIDDIVDFASTHGKVVLKTGNIMSTTLT